MAHPADETPATPEVHHCESHRDGDWITYFCPLCPDYERRINWRTGEVTIRTSTPEILHDGRYYPFEYHEAFRHTN